VMQDVAQPTETSVDAAVPEVASEAAADVQCPNNWTCSGRCVDELTDPENCGACGRACAVGCHCENFNCLSPDGGAICFR
jgi:hypothetical protein